ncbi:MAG: hypothetical protein L3K25_05535 [Gammaproteobacteria bacterium]|nr:hypothetical protein [Gammaproteobacteria bacterium]
MERETLELIFLILFFLGVILIFLMIALMFYIGRTRIKEIDKVVYGFEFPNDSIFALGLRVPSYGGAFLWKWSAKRSGLEGKIEHFDKRFRWPFIAVFLLMIFGVLMMILAGVFRKYAGIE